MSMLNWAKREVEIACERENPDRKEGGDLYERSLENDRRFS